MIPCWGNPDTSTCCLHHLVRVSRYPCRCITVVCITGVGGAISLRGEAIIRNCSFTSNLASDRGLAVSAVGVVNVKVSSFDGNNIICGEGEMMQQIREV